MELKDTVKMMNSDDYKERFKAEYTQVKLRYDKLHKMVIKHEAKTLNFKPSCSIELLKEQKKHMGNYLYCLEVRAEIEGISLENLDEEYSYKEYLSCTCRSAQTSTGANCGDTEGVYCTNGGNANDNHNIQSQNS